MKQVDIGNIQPLWQYNTNNSVFFLVKKEELTIILGYAVHFEYFEGNQISLHILETSVNYVDHSLQLSEDLGRLFDSEEGCDFLIHAHTYTGENREDGLWEMVNTTVCAHRMILSRFPGLKASTDVDEISIYLTQTCRPHLPMFIRYRPHSAP